MKYILGETSFCWAFSIATMLRQSLKIFLKTLPATYSSHTLNALQKIEENDFHKQLRNELIMLPIPKAKFFSRKVPTGVNREDFKDEIIDKQTHVLQSAISRVSLNQSPYRRSKYNFFKLVNPSVMDPEGILMLNSIREIFDALGLHFEFTKFISEKFDTERSIINAINNQKKCPAIVGAKFDFSTSPVTIDAHVMAAAGVKSDIVRHASFFRRQKTEHFIQCKNSYRDDPNQSGKFHH